MTISVIIPAYQCKAVLRKTVSCVLKAKLDLAEVLLIDDGSTDGTAAICDHLVVENPLIRCIHKENGGVSSARNLGIQQAKGDYIWFVDSDDEVCPISAKQMEVIFTSRPDIVLFGVEMRFYRRDHRLRSEKHQMPERLDLTADQVGKYLTKLFYANYLSPVWNKLFRRQLLQENQLRFDPALTNYEDLAFSLDAMSHSKNLSILPDIYYLYKTEYDHDRTIDRIARIDNVAANTDLIAEAFFHLSDACFFDQSAMDQMKHIVLHIYLDLFRVKIRTTPLIGVRKQCEDFLASSYFAECQSATSRLSASSQKLLAQIRCKRILAIWLKVRYRKIRNAAAKFIRPLLHRK